MSASGAAPGPIQLRVEKTGQLFHTLDPLPFRERDLDAVVEEYVVGWAGELPANRPLAIQVRLPPAEAAGEDAGHIAEAMRNYFAYRAQVMGWELRDLFRTGRVALAIGLSVLAACIVLGTWRQAQFGSDYLRRFFYEGLIILGWVANWRPIEIFLFDWWPITRRRRLYRRLAVATVDVVADGGAEGPRDRGNSGGVGIAPRSA